MPPGLSKETNFEKEMRIAYGLDEEGVEKRKTVDKPMSHEEFLNICDQRYERGDDDSDED